MFGFILVFCLTQRVESMNMVADRSGNIHSVWAEYGEIYYAVDENGNWSDPVRDSTGSQLQRGEAFSNGVNISQTPTESTEPSIYCCGDSIIVIWCEAMNSAEKAVYLRAKRLELGWRETLNFGSYTRELLETLHSRFLPSPVQKFEIK